MDRWEASLEDFQKSQTLDSFGSVLRTAESILKEDLAPFELDWFVQTLLSEPVSVLDIVSAKASDDAWSKVVKDAYKLLSDLVENHYDAVQQYIDSIISECQKQHDARTRSHALQCLASCVKQAMPAALASQYTAELAQASTCKAPLALLVGTICEYHPEIVADQINTIWRNYLNLLASNKNTDLVCKSLLKGVWGLFKHFGGDIPLTELSLFYDKLSREYLRRCDGAVLAILRDYASLFKERLAEDDLLRRELWTFEDLTPVLPVYEQAASVLTKEQLQKILRKEIAPKTCESYAKLKFTALRVCMMLHKRYGVCVDGVLNVDVYSLEFELRQETSYDVAEAVSWSIECNMVNSEKLLQTSIMFYHNLPAKRRKDIVVNGLLNSPADVMSATINFLITESCHNDSSLLTYLPLWRDIFDSTLIDKKKLLFEKYINNVLLVIENFLEDFADKIFPDKLASLLTLSSHVLTLQPVEDYTSDQCALVSSKLVELSLECGLEASVVAVARAMTPHLDNDSLKNIFKMIQIDKCEDESLLCESCLALMHAPHTTDPNVLLKALQVIFSRKDAEPKTLSLAIHKLEQLIVKENNNLNNASVSKCIQLIKKLRSRKDLIGKDARVLARDVTLFLGKYLHFYNDAVNSEDNSLIVKLRDVLTLDVPNPIEGTTYKMNLHRLLHLAIIDEHEESLRMMLNIICANLCNSKSALLQAALGRAVRALCRAAVGAAQPTVARHAATHFCGLDATLYIMQQINRETSPAVRRMLADTIEGILLKDPGSTANEQLLTAVYSELSAMMKSNSSLNLGVLDITEALLTSLKVNRQQTKQMLPSLIISITKTHEPGAHTVFEIASQLFIDNIGLFSASVIDSTIIALIETLFNQDITSVVKAKIYKNALKSTLDFARKVFDDIGENCAKITRIIFDLEPNSESVKFLYLWSEIPKAFDLKEDDVKEILEFENSVILNRLFDVRAFENCFAFEAHLRFINQYTAVLLKFHSEATLKHISGIIEKLPPIYVRSIRKHLSECLSHCQQICHNIPAILLKSFENWSENLSIKIITEYIEKERYISDHALNIHSLNNMLDIFRLKDPTSILTTVSIYAKTWTKTLLKLTASGHTKYLTKEVPYLSDLLSVSLRFLTVTDIKQVLLQGHGLEGAGNDKLGVEFARFFMPVFIKYLVRKPFLLMQDGMEACWVLLNDMVKWSVRKRWHDEQLKNLLELVDLLWPIYEPKASFKAKHTLLLDLSCLNVKLAPHSRPMQWAMTVVGSDEAKRDDRIALVTVLPGGEEYSETYRRYASLLPTRLSDMDAACGAALRALLDALAGGADTALLDIVITLADGEATAGWWDEAFASCMASLACLPTAASLLVRLHAPHTHTTAAGAVCRRLLVPLLRCAPSSLCEGFFASILKETLERLSTGVRAPSLHPDYRACVVQKTIILDILQVLFEKVPPAKIESPSSSLYEHIQTDKPWHLAREVIRLCYKLRDKLVTPEGATDALSTICREFQYAAYKCVCACVCVRRPDANIYNTVFDLTVWTRIVDESVVYDLPLKTEWNRHKIHSAVSIPVTGVGQRARSATRTRSLSRSRVFLRTLSENPLEYDLIDHQDDDTDTQDIELTDSSLNNHPCAATLTALFQHAAGLDHFQWRAVLCEALASSPRNVRWLLAGVICNCKEELKSHAVHLRPALLSVVEETAQDSFNSLHVDILNTLIYWNSDECSTEIPGLNTVVTGLVGTALKNSARNAIFRMLEDVLENLLKIYGRCIEGDLNVIATSFDDPNRTKACLKLLLRFVKHKVNIPEIISWLITKLAENYRVYKSEMSLLAEVIGIGVSNSTEQDKIISAAKLKKVLEEVRRNNVSDYVKIIYYSGCCDQQQFRCIVDLTQKLPEADKKRCLQVICTYIREHPGSAEIDEVPANTKQMADLISVDRQFEELFTTTPQFLKPSSHPAKRVKVDISSPILNTIGRNEKYISEVLARLGREKGNRGKGKIEEKLSKNNMAVRFVECFYITIYLPLKYHSATSLSVCMSAFLQMLFSHLKTQENFRDKKLRDEPWIVVHPIGLSKSRSKKIVGTLRSFAYDTNTRENYEEEIDVQVTIEKILDTFVQFAKVTPEAAMELLTQLLRCLAGRGFDPRPELSKLLSTLLTKAPELVVIARECVDQLVDIDGFSETVDKLKKSTLGSEGEQLFRLLHEETRMRSAGNLFVLGTSDKDDNDIRMLEDTEFSIEGLVSAFQKLSNWDEVTYQERKRVEVNLPALWTDRERSKELLDEYPDTNGWFGEMVQLYRENRKDVMKWLRLMDRWPRRHYVLSSVIEAMHWHCAEIDNNTIQLPCYIQKNDCLAEWAARLMLRTAYLSSKQDGDASKLSRSHELVWCESANERGLHNLALSVIQRNCLDLEGDETLLWMEQKMLAHTGMGFELNDSSELEKALQVAKHLPLFYEQSTSEAIISVNKLIMQVNYKLKSLSPSKIENIIEVVDAQINSLNKIELSSKNKRNVTKLYETAVLYYNGLWDLNELSKDDIILKICDYIGTYNKLGIDVASVAAIALNRLNECKAIDDTAAAALLAKLKPIISSLPSCYMDQLKAKISLFSTHVVRASGITELQGESVLDKYRQCLQLLCHADYLLLQYCDELYRTLQNEDSKWHAVFKRMKSRLFENEYAGTDYQALSKYKNTLYSLQTSDSEMRRIVLKGMLQDLKSKPARETIRLSHVCPSLARLDPADPSCGIERLLRLPPGVRVVRIEEELVVFTDSVRRPCVVSALTCDGRRRRYLHKNEDLRADAALTHLTEHTASAYTVIPLGDDCGLIEFLEDHVRIRELIASTCKVDELQIIRQAVKEDELILMPKTSCIQNFKEICSKIPAYALRSAIELHCCSVQDFISKKRRFVDTLCDMTLLNWLFGLGDRHLQNILYSIKDGGVQCIDWGAIFQYDNTTELPPARLTRNMLAMCDTAVLESRLQSKLKQMRDSRQLTLPMLKLAFRWMEDFPEKLIYIEGILCGRMGAHHLTRHALQCCPNKPHSVKYLQLLDAVFSDQVDRERYSVQEQVSSLLLHCTDPWILSVTRTGWEPWL